MATLAVDAIRSLIILIRTDSGPLNCVQVLFLGLPELKNIARAC